MEIVAKLLSRFWPWKLRGFIHLLGPPFHLLWKAYCPEVFERMKMPWLSHGGSSEPAILRSHQGRVVKANPSFSLHLSQVKHWEFWYQTKDDFLPCSGSSFTLTFLLNGLGCCLQSCAPKRVHFRRARLVFVIASCYMRMPTTKFKDWQSRTQKAPLLILLYPFFVGIVIAL